MTVLKMAEFLDTFDDFRHQVFRLESLDCYDSPSERAPLERFRSGEAQDSTWLNPWAERVRSINDRRGSISRAHVVSEPLTEYVRFEMTCAYPANAESGEDIRILPREQAEGLAIPKIDFWLFDDERTGAMVYDETGTLAHVEVTRDPATVRDHVRWREVARKHAVPLNQYLAGLKPQVGRTAAQ